MVEKSTGMEDLEPLEPLEPPSPSPPPPPPENDRYRDYERKPAEGELTRVVVNTPVV
jgi:hypothetical protein